MIDNYGRKIDYLRISLTDRCNFRCTYCMPEHGVKMIGHNEVLTFEEIIRLAEISVELGVSKIRLTGGEPLVRKGIETLISRLAAVNGINNISMTTNGFLLEEMAYDLKSSGLDRLNISLDTVNREKFRKITRIDGLGKVFKGIEAATNAGFSPIKLNAVAIRGINDDEILDLADYSARRGLILRFIEQMPFIAEERKTFIPASEIISVLSGKYGSAKPLKDEGRNISAGSGPVSLYSFGNTGLMVGFITPVSNHFCGNCNRLRITADGKLKLCLLSDNEIDLRLMLRNGSSNNQIKRILKASVDQKPEKHKLNSGYPGSERGMSKIGG